VIGRFRLIAAAIATLLIWPATLALAAPQADQMRSASPRAAGPDAQSAQSALITQDSVASYARREAADKSLEQFEGGGAGIYIGGSTLGIVLLIVILIVLL
jgi:hypothetical protein